MHNFSDSHLWEFLLGIIASQSILLTCFPCCTTSSSSKKQKTYWEQNWRLGTFLLDCLHAHSTHWTPLSHISRWHHCFDLSEHGLCMWVSCHKVPEINMGQRRTPNLKHFSNNWSCYDWTESRTNRANIPVLSTKDYKFLICQNSDICFYVSEISLL